LTTFRSAFERTLRLSQYVSRISNARPGVVEDLERRESRALGRDEMRSALAGDDEGLPSRLRQLRDRVMVGLAHRDLNGLADLSEVFATMTALAEESVRAALPPALRVAKARFGEPAAPMELTVMALGKLGGEELNVSSDIDLVFLYPAEGETHGARIATHRELFDEAGRALIVMLSKTTEEGQAFRVDMRLRPFGDGPLATSLTGLEDYFVSHARPWERYAWLKARAIAGHADEVAGLIEPFVYRRYLDYGMLEQLRELQARIFETAMRRRKADDIKVGAGGIREIEFAVQLFQMVRGGREAALRTPSTRAALKAIGDKGLLAPDRVRDLGQAYEFLRRLEHRLQYYDDQQTQALPRSAEHQAVIAEGMGYSDYAALLAALDLHRARVQAIFNELFEQQPAHRGEVSLVSWLFDPQAAPDPEGLAEDLREGGIADAAEVAAALIEFTRSRRYRALSDGTRTKLERLLPGFVAAVVEQGGHAVTATRLLTLFEAIDRRDSYYSLLLEHPQVLRRAARLVTRSAWAARLLSRHPILLDDLTRASATFGGWAEERASLVAECRALGGDVERILDNLRHFKQRHLLRLTMADLEGELAVMALSDELSSLADVLLDVTLEEAARSMSLGPHRHGDDDALPSTEGICIVAYGKLGGKELGYGGDLDIIFLHDEAGGVAYEGLARLAQRVITWITSLTPAGVLYETDLRLRPDGAKGLLVSSLAAFRDYQLKRAWTWEHQALTRARFSAGDAALGARFEALRDEVLARPRDRGKLLADISAMRKRMRTEAGSKKSEDLKHVAGGVIDLEFCVQALVLSHGPEHPALRENKGNHMLLHRAGDLGLIDKALASAAAEAYLAMRRRTHDAALNDEETVKIEGGELREEREAVKRLWTEVFGAA
jgi:glutamate-ammonia-ligase adenylyltransferase